MVACNESFDYRHKDETCRVGMHMKRDSSPNMVYRDICHIYIDVSLTRTSMWVFSRPLVAFTFGTIAPQSCMDTLRDRCISGFITLDYNWVKFRELRALIHDQRVCLRENLCTKKY